MIYSSSNKENDRTQQVGLEGDEVTFQQDRVVYQLRVKTMMEYFHISLSELDLFLTNSKQ